MKISIIQVPSCYDLRSCKNYLTCLGLKNLKVLLSDDIEGIDLNSTVEDILLKLDYDIHKPFNLIILTNYHLLMNSYNISSKFNMKISLTDLLIKNDIHICYQIGIPKYDSKYLKLVLNKLSNEGKIDDFIKEYNTYINLYGNHLFYINEIDTELCNSRFLMNFIIGGIYAK